MKTLDPFSLRRTAQQLRREELARIAGVAAIKWSTFRKALHAPLPRQVAPSPHP